MKLTLLAAGVGFGVVAASADWQPSERCSADNQGLVTWHAVGPPGNASEFQVLCNGTNAYVAVNATSQLIADGTNYKGETVTTTFTYARLQYNWNNGFVTGFALDVDDMTFATSEGKVITGTDDWDTVTEMALGRGSQCGLTSIPSADVWIDLSAGPFRFHPSLQATNEGSQVFGSNTINDARDVWHANLIGWCAGSHWSINDTDVFGIPVVLGSIE